MVVATALAPHPDIPRTDKPLLVCILDGWGANVAEDEYNAIHVAETPTTDALKVGACPPHVSLVRLLVQNLERAAPYLSTVANLLAQTVLTLVR